MNLLKRALGLGEKKKGFRYTENLVCDILLFYKEIRDYCDENGLDRKEVLEEILEPWT